MIVQRIVREYAERRLQYIVERDGRWRRLEGDLFGEWHAGEDVAPPTHVVAPVVPSKIVGIGLNYRDHALERGKPLPSTPLVFLKPPSAVIGPGHSIVIPAGVGRVDHEAELGIVIRRRASKVPVAEALDYVLGYTCANDVTARDLQTNGVQFSHCKGFDTFAPIGPAIAVGLDPSALDVTGLVNGDVRQQSNTRELIFPVAALVSYISHVMTLVAGDVIATGTPAGIGPLAAGDTVTVRISGIGDLTNPVVAAD